MGRMSDLPNHHCSPKVSEEPMMSLGDSFSSQSIASIHTHDDVEVASEGESPNRNIVKKETQAVRRLKIVVLTILLLSAAVTATCVYVFVSKNEQEKCMEQFQSSAAKVLNAVSNSIDQTLIPMDALAVDLVSYARATNSPWPFVTLPEFGLRMSKSLPLTDAMMIQYLPLVQPQKRAEWEEYVSQNNAWVNETMKLQETWDGYNGIINYNWTARDIIYGDDGDIDANVRYVSFTLRWRSALNGPDTAFFGYHSRPMAPAWEVFPVVVEVRSITLQTFLVRPLFSLHLT
jgi:hypothetical protein